MTATLTQSTSAAHPDRGNIGLHVALSAGNDGAYLRHDLGSAVSTLHVRFALNPADAAGGAVQLAGALDATQAPVWWLAYDTATRQVTVTFSNGQTLNATLNALDWHSIEVGLDVSAGEAELWVDGLSRDTASAPFAGLAAQHTWLGAAFKDTALAGALYLDEWRMADTFIGPVIATPTSDYADDPARWLVIYNDAEPDSLTWAEAYRAARGVPYANLLGLDLSTSEVITHAEYDALVTAVDDYLAQTGLDAQVMGILCGYRVPGYMDYDSNGILDPVPALLHGPGALLGSVANPNAADALPTRPRHSDLAGTRMTARMDGPDLNSALALIQRSDDLMSQGLEDGAEATLWFDPFVNDWLQMSDHVARMNAYVNSIDIMRLRLPLQFSGDITGDPYQSFNFTQVHNDGFVWSWDPSIPPTVPPDFFADPAGKRVVCLQIHLLSETATTVRSGTASNWIEAALSAGYAAAVASSRSYTGSAVPYARPFFDALRRGWALGEAWYLALTLLRQGMYLVGDPLLHAAFPQRGWDVFGPTDRLTSIEPDAPVRALHEMQTSLALPGDLQPADGDRALYVVRHVDDHGRQEASCRTAHVANIGGAAAAPPLTPSWPDHSNWPVHIDGGQLLVTLIWDRPLSTCNVTTLELRGEVDGNPETTLASPAIDGRSPQVRVTLPLPAQSARYRWRIHSPDGVTLHTPWSRTIQPRAAGSTSLTILETQP